MLLPSSDDLKPHKSVCGNLTDWVGVGGSLFMGGVGGRGSLFMCQFHVFAGKQLCIACKISHCPCGDDLSFTASRETKTRTKRK